MALLFMDSFDHYTTADFLEKWTAALITGSGAAVTVDAASGRRGTQGLKCTYSSVTGTYAVGSKTVVASGPTCIVGCAVKTDIAPAPSGTAIIGIADTDVAQVVLVLMSDMRLQVVRGAVPGGPVLGTTTVPVMGVNTFAYVELKVTIDPAVGTVDVRVDGVSVLSLTAQNTRGGTTNTWNQVRVGINAIANPGGPTNECMFDDLYVCDGSGPAPWNTFFGDCRVDARISSSGTVSQWTPTSGGNYTNIDDATPNDDTDYNSAVSVGLTDTFNVEDAPVVGAAIFGVQSCLSMKKMDAGVCSVAAVARIGTTNYAGADLPPATGYVYGLQTWPANPATGAPWLEADFNAAQFGYKKTA